MKRGDGPLSSSKHHSETTGAGNLVSMGLAWLAAGFLAAHGTPATWVAALLIAFVALLGNRTIAHQLRDHHDMDRRA